MQRVVWLLMAPALIVLTLACADTAPRSEIERACSRTSDQQLCESEAEGYVAADKPVALCLSEETKSWYFMPSRRTTAIGDPCSSAGGFEVIAVLE